MRNKVLIIQNEDIRGLKISPQTCMAWVEESFKMKYESQLPAKVSVHPQGNDFFTSMPVLLPPQYGIFGIKEVYRILGRNPSLSSDILLYDSKIGKLLAILDGDWITTMRTGAVAALTIKRLQKTTENSYSFIGLGNTARATALCLLEEFNDRPVKFRLLRYKNQAKLFMERFQQYDHVTFEIIETIDQMVAGSDVLISSITDSAGLICDKKELYNPGMLLVPIHTRGFQNCDLFFDKVYGDDTDHIKGFRNFNQFKTFDEFGQVLLGKNKGRERENERIIAYNIGLGLHDVLFAYKIYKELRENSLLFFEQKKEEFKFWI